MTGVFDALSTMLRWRGCSLVPFNNMTDYTFDAIVEGSLYKSSVLFGNNRIGVVSRHAISDVRPSSDAGVHRAAIVIYHDVPAYFNEVDNDPIEYEDIGGWGVRWVARRV